MRTKRINRAQMKQYASAYMTSSLRRSLRLYLIISVIIFIFVIINTIRSDANGLVVAAGLVAGVLVGAMLSRINKIAWDENTHQVFSRIDAYGLLLLFLYIAFDVSRTYLVDIFITGKSVGPTSLALLSGAFYGRVIGMGRTALRIIRSQQVLTSQSNKAPGNIGRGTKD